MRRVAPAGLALVAGLLAACSADLPQNTLAPAGENARIIADLFAWIFWWALGVFVVVEALLVYTVIRFRQRSVQVMPPQIHGHTRLEIAWTIAPVLVLASIAVPTVQALGQLSEPPSSNRLDVQVIAHQWWWEFHYPELGVVTANEMHVPVGTVVNTRLNSADVLHSFWIPRLAGKLDIIPGRTNTMWFNANEPGIYLGQCAELCGLSHALMKFRVIAQPKEEFEGWVRDQKTAPPAPTGPAAGGAQVFVAPQKLCVTCHTVAGTEAKAEVGPNLTHVGSRTTIAAGVLDNTPENLARWLRDPAAVKPGSKMPRLPLTEQDISALVAYLGSLR